MDRSGAGQLRQSRVSRAQSPDARDALVKPRRIVFYVLLAIGPPLVLGLAILLLERMSLAPDGSIGHTHAAGLVSLLVTLLPLVLLLLGFVALVYVKNRMVGFMLMASCIAFTVAASTITDLRQGIRDTAFENLVLRTGPLIAAIHEYERVRGVAPDELDYLVPQYLRSIPATELGAYPEFDYQTVSDPALVGDNPWMLALPISTSPESSLVYLPRQNYEVLTGVKEPVGNWAYVYQRPPGREQVE